MNTTGLPSKEQFRQSFRIQLRPQSAPVVTGDLFGDISKAPAMPVGCDHVGTGRESQRRLFASGFETICSRCGAVASHEHDLGSPALD